MSGQADMVPVPFWAPSTSIISYCSLPCLAPYPSAASAAQAQR